MSMETFSNVKVLKELERKLKPKAATFINEKIAQIQEDNNNLNSKLRGTEQLVIYGFIIVSLTVVGLFLMVFALLMDFFYFKSNLIMNNNESVQPSAVYVYVNSYNSNVSTSSLPKFNFAE